MHPEEPVTIQLTPVVRDVVNESRPLCERRAIDLGFSHRGMAECPLRINLFKSALRHLLISRIRLLPPGGNLAVDVNNQESEACVSVSDDCPSLPESMRAELPGRVHGGDRRERYCLYQIYWTIMVAHHGTVQLDTRGGRGMTFRLQLPTAVVATQRPSRQADSSRVIQLRCCLCDHWKHNGGSCPGAAECFDLAFLV